MSQLQPNPAIVPVPVLAAAAVSLITAAAVPIPGTEGPTETIKFRIRYRNLQSYGQFQPSSSRQACINILVPRTTSTMAELKSLVQAAWIEQGMTPVILAWHRMWQTRCIIMVGNVEGWKIVCTCGKDEEVVRMMAIQGEGCGGRIELG